MRKFFLTVLLAGAFSIANAADVTAVTCSTPNGGETHVMVFCTDGRSCDFILKIQGDETDYNNVMSQVMQAAKRFCASNFPCFKVSQNLNAKAPQTLEPKTSSNPIPGRKIK